MSRPAAKANEFTFQNEIIQYLKQNGWLIGKPENYNRELALYEEDTLTFIKESQPEQWKKYCAIYPNNPEQKLLERIASQLNKVDPNAANKEMRTFGTLGVLRHEIRDRGTRFSLCQFKPEHDLNPDTLAKYKQNRLRIVPELVYSPWATEKHLSETGTKAKAWRIDLVLFVNGLPIVTMELKSEFKQAVQKAITQYKTCIWQRGSKVRTRSFCRLTKALKTVARVMTHRKIKVCMQRIICGMRYCCRKTF